MPVDHRKLGRELDIFDSDPLIGAGLPFWLPAGAAARHEVESYVRELERRAGYQHVYSPVLGKRQMYELSGHWANFADDMFPPMPLGGDHGERGSRGRGEVSGRGPADSGAGPRPDREARDDADDQDNADDQHGVDRDDVDDRGGSGRDALVLRPGLCPHHALIYRSRQRSHRDLPLRIAELGSMYRAERSGVLGGLARVRSISLNDGHVFCAAGQVGDEVAGVLRLIRQAHVALGLDASSYRLSLRGSGGKYAGDGAAWAEAERLLREALDAVGVSYRVASDEAAFYGPKIDVQVADPAGREWTLSTVQVDFHQPARFDLWYVDGSGGRSRPVMVHRSLVGSMERLFAHLIEVHGGAFPVWYSPVQFGVVPVGVAQRPAADEFARLALDAGLRAEVYADGSVGARVRHAARRKVPYLAVIGDRECASGGVALRLRDGRRLPPMPAAEAVALVSAVAAARSPELLPSGAGAR